MVKELIFGGTFTRSVDNGALAIPPKMPYFGTLPKRWYSRVENKKIFFFPGRVGGRRLLAVEVKSRNRIFIKALLRAAKLPFSGEIVVHASYHGDFMVLRKKRAGD